MDFGRDAASVPQSDAEVITGLIGSCEIVEYFDFDDQIKRMDDHRADILALETSSPELEKAVLEE